jgi:hypothetical protein
VEEEKPFLVLFELDVLDRDVSVNLRTYVTDATGENLELFMEGSDPMEIVHDREPERYSKPFRASLKKERTTCRSTAITRYILRSKLWGRLRQRPGRRPVGAHYYERRRRLGGGSARDIYRIENQHDSTLRCTACHPSIFSTEAFSLRSTDIRSKPSHFGMSWTGFITDRPRSADRSSQWQRYRHSHAVARQTRDGPRISRST